MFGKIAVSLVLVSICASQKRQFIQIPFDESERVENPRLAPSASHPPRGRFPASQPLNGLSDQLSHSDFQDQLTHHNRFNVNPAVATSKQQFPSIPEDQLGSPPFGGSFSDSGALNINNPHRFQAVKTTQQRPQARRRRPTTPAPIPTPTHLQVSEFPVHHPIPTPSFDQHPTLHPEQLHSRFQNDRFTQVMLIMPAPTPDSFPDSPTPQSLFGPNPDHQFLSSVPQPSEAPRSTNTFFSLEEPVLRPIQAVAPTRPVEAPHAQAFVTRAQPAIRAPVAPPPPQPTVHHGRPSNQRVNSSPRFGGEHDYIIHAQPSVRAPPQASRFGGEQDYIIHAQPSVRAPPQDPRFSSEQDFIIHTQPSVRVPPQAPVSHNERAHLPSRAPEASLGDSRQRDLEEKLFRQQAESAQYSFASQIDDSISGTQNQREEVRDGLAVKGMYSYSDGYVRRTVQYEADDKGYRVVNQQEEPLGDGPLTDPRGHADVSTFVDGNAVQYSITAADIQDPQNRQLPSQVI